MPWKLTFKVWYQFTISIVKLEVHCCRFFQVCTMHRDVENMWIAKLPCIKKHKVTHFIYPHVVIDRWIDRSNIQPIILLNMRMGIYETTMYISHVSKFEYDSNTFWIQENIRRVGFLLPAKVGNRQETNWTTSEL